MLRQRIAAAIAKGLAGLDELAGSLVVIGTGLMDLYTGTLTPHEIGSEVIRQLIGNRPAGAGLRSVPGSRRAGAIASCPLAMVPSGCCGPATTASEYVHVHPGRWVPWTCRVRANILKTAILVLAQADLQDGDPRDAALLNAVRQRYLGLSPLGRHLERCGGVGQHHCNAPGRPGLTLPCRATVNLS